MNSTAVMVNSGMLRWAQTWDTCSTPHLWIAGAASQRKGVPHRKVGGALSGEETAKERQQMLRKEKTEQPHSY